MDTEKEIYEHDFSEEILSEEETKGVYKIQKEFLEDYAEDAAKDNINCKTILEVGSAKNAILETAKDQNADLIMMGASGTNSFTRLFIGSTTDFIVQNSKVDVFVVKTHMDNTTRPTH